MENEVESNSDLEKEFQAAYDKALPLIKEQLREARDALTRATAIANEYGVPFRSGVSPLAQGYIPTSFEEKFSKLDSEIVSDISGVYDPHGDGLYPGWQHSAVC